MKYSGTKESAVIDIPAKEVNTSSISWVADPKGGQITVETNVTLDGTTWQGWKTCTSGGSIPDLAQGTDTTNAKMKYRVTLETNGTVSPVFNSIDISITDASQRAVKQRGADNTNYMLKWEEAIKEARVDGQTVIDGGYINTDILQIDYGIIVGNKPPADADVTAYEPQDYSWILGTEGADKPTQTADNTQDELNWGAAIDYATVTGPDNQSGWTIIEGGYINTGILLVGAAQIETAAIGTAHIEDLSVETIKIKERAATEPVGNYVSGSKTLSTSWQDFAEVSLDCEGQPIAITFSMLMEIISIDKEDPTFNARILIEGIQEFIIYYIPIPTVYNNSLAEWNGYGSFSYSIMNTNTSGSGLTTVTLQLTGNDTPSASKRYLQVTAMKR